MVIFLSNMRKSLDSFHFTNARQLPLSPLLLVDNFFAIEWKIKSTRSHPQARYNIII